MERICYRSLGGFVAVARARWCRWQRRGRVGLPCASAVLIAAVLLVAGCATPAAGVARAPGANATAAATGSGDGRSFETAIVISAVDESAGVKAEYAWIREHLPGAQPLGQSLLSHGAKSYDLVRVKLPDGSVREVYFDISSFFGKF